MDGWMDGWMDGRERETIRITKRGDLEEDHDIHIALGSGEETQLTEIVITATSRASEHFEAFLLVVPIPHNELITDVRKASAKQLRCYTVAASLQKAQAAAPLFAPARLPGFRHVPALSLLDLIAAEANASYAERREVTEEQSTNTNSESLPVYVTVCYRASAYRRAFYHSPHPAPLLLDPILVPYTVSLPEDGKTFTGNKLALQRRFHRTLKSACLLTNIV